MGQREYLRTLVEDRREWGNGRKEEETERMEVVEMMSWIARHNA